MGTNYQRMILTFSSFKGDAVCKSLKINHCRIAVCNRAVFYGYGSCIALSFLLDLAIQFFFCHCSIHFRNRDTLIFTKRYLRFNSNLCRVNKSFSLFNLRNVNVRSGNNFNTGLIHSLRIGLSN